jgi:RNA polymerase sigma factor (TIGR02999 family)
MAVDPLKDYASVLYDRLRALARARMLGQRAGHTLDPTGLAHEAIMRLLKCDPGQINDEEHFMTLAAEAMRQILVDHARARAAKKRGGGEKRVSLDDQDDAAANEPFGRAVQLRMDPVQLLAINEALDDLEKVDRDAAQIVKMRTFAGMNPDEIAALLGASRRTVERRWRYAMAELRVRLSEKPGDDSTGKQGHD